MGNFLLLYHGGSAPTTPEEGERVMTAWTGWFTQLGSAVVDQGNPTSTSRTVDAAGATSNGSGSGVTGYSILSADSIDGAVEIAKGCPHRASGGSVEVVQVDALM